MTRTTDLFSETDDPPITMLERFRRDNPRARLLAVYRVADTGIGPKPLFRQHWQVRWEEWGEGWACGHGYRTVEDCPMCGPEFRAIEAEDVKVEAWRERG